MSLLAEEVSWFISVEVVADDVEEEIDVLNVAIIRWTQ
jgi:hypothetical protein